MRKPLIAGNWKMYTTIPEAINLVNTVRAGVHSISGVDVVVCPPFVSLHTVSQALDRCNVEIGAQNMYSETEGAFTGEISPMMLKDAGCRFVILGHSERRTIFHETDAMINKKVLKALQYNIVPIVCVGETLAEREQGNMKSVIKTQFEGSLKGLTKDQVMSLVIAYEPVWAIGTGKTATPQQAEEVHKFIRQLLTQAFDVTVSDAVRILYGGSVKPENAYELMKKENIDGALVGGASLKAEQFIQIIAKTRQTLDDKE